MENAGENRTGSRYLNPSLCKNLNIEMGCKIPALNFVDNRNLQNENCTINKARWRDY